MFIKEIKVRGDLAQIARINRLRLQLDDPDISPAVRKIGEVWQQNFDGEGSSVGGWAPLGEATRRVRAFRGYDPEHPILRQSGELRVVAIEMPLNDVRGASSRYSGDGVHGSISKGKRRATLTISGKKVENQYGASGTVEASNMYAPGPQTWSMPARRFWFVDGAVRTAAYEGVRESVEKILRDA